MNKINQAEEFVLEWQSDSRYFEKRPALYFRAITVLAVLISLLLFFLKEILLIILVWLVFFVVYMRSIVPPVKTKYELNRFGINFFGGLIPYKQIAVFTVLPKKKTSVLRLVLQPEGLQHDLVLTQDEQQNQKIITFLKQKAPFLESLPENGIERFSRLLGRLTGLGS